MITNYKKLSPESAEVMLSDSHKRLMAILDLLALPEETLSINKDLTKIIPIK